MKRRILKTMLSIGLAATWAPGCAQLGTLREAATRNSAKDVGPTRQQRKETVARDFDRQRDDAQFDAAASFWKRGDEESCRKMLVDLLERNPNYRSARLLLADVYLFKGQLELSEAELNKVLAANPKDAQAQHALAEVLDACGRRQEAQAHHDVSVQLEPTNEVYALSRKASLETPLPSSRPSESIALAKAQWVKTSMGQSQSAKELATPQPDAPTIAQSAPAKVGPNDLPPQPMLSPYHSSESHPVFLAAAENENPLQLLRPFANIDEWVRPVDFEVAIRDENAASVDAIPSAVGRLQPVTMELNLQPVPSESPTRAAASNTPAVSASRQPSTQNNPQNPKSPLQQAVEALAQGDSEKAIDQASRAISESFEPPAALYRVLGAAHYRRGEYRAAQAALAQALSLDKSDALSYFLMGSTLEKLNEHQAATRHFAEAAHLDARFAH